MMVSAVREAIVPVLKKVLSSRRLNYAAPNSIVAAISVRHTIAQPIFYGRHDFLRRIIALISAQIRRLILTLRRISVIIYA